MRTLFSISIRTQLFLMVLLIALPAAGIIVYAGLQARQGAVQEALQVSQSFGDGIAESQRNMHTSAEQLMSALAQLPQVKVHDAAGMQVILSQLLKEDPRYSNILIADRAGKVWASGLGSVPYSVADRLYFKNAVATGKFSSGEYAIGRGSSKPSFHFGYPLKDEKGSVVGVFCLGFNLDYFKQNLRQAKLPPGTNYLLIDRSGVILSSGMDSAHLTGRKFSPELFAVMRGGAGRGEFVGTGSYGTKRVSSYRTLRLDHEPEPYMYIRAGMPFRLVVKDADQVLLKNLAIFACCLFCTTLLAWLIGKRSISDRILVLQAAAQRLAGGDRSIRTSKMVQGGELGALGASFDEMAREIELRELGQLTTELELKKKEFHYRSIFENSLFGIAVTGLDFNFLQVNDAFCRLVGYSEVELLDGLGLADISHPEDLAQSLAMLRRIHSLELDHYVMEKRYIAKSGVSMEVMLFAHGIYNEYGDCTGATASVLDLTERKQTVEVLRESEENLRVLAEALPVGVGFYDEQRRVQYVNGCFLDWFGYTLEEIPTVDDWFLKAYPDPDYRRDYLARLAAATDEAKLSGTPMTPISAMITCKNGSVRHVVISYQFSQRRTLTLFTDITERELQQGELLKAQKLESLGVLAGGIAHDFNNILTGIMGNISIAQLYLDPPHESRQPLERAEKASKRAAELAYQLLTFAKGGKPVKSAVSVEHLVQETVSLVLRGANVKAFIDIPAGLHAIEADEGQISQTFHNIVINAVQAMPQGGALSVAAQNVAIAPKSLLPLPPGEYVKISFADQGTGMTAEAQARIFDPYFTTKPDGTGLGLASVHSIVSKHGGHVEVSSSLGVGTTFDFYLPSTGQVWQGRQGELEPLRGDGQNGGTILVMDDEEMICKVLTEMLKKLGCRTVTSNEGGQAVELYRSAFEAGTPFAAVILDLTVPGGMGGREAAQRIIALDPAARVIVSSGYSNDPVMAEYRSHGLSGAVLKPYRVAELAQGLAFLQEPAARECRGE